MVAFRETGSFRATSVIPSKDRNVCPVPAVRAMSLVKSIFFQSSTSTSTKEES